MIQKIRKKKQQFEQNISPTNQRLWNVFLFLIRLTLLSAPLYILLWTGWNPEWLRELNAQLSSIILKLLGLSVEHSGSFVTTPALRLDVSVDSTGWKSFLALTALILATRGEGLFKRLYGIVAGLLVIFIGNLARIVSMMYAVEVWGISYDFLHTFLWRWGLTALVFIFWISWLKWDPREDQLRNRLRTLLPSRKKSSA